MVQVICDSCHSILSAPGALIVSPVNQDGGHDEFHLCKTCYEAAMHVIFESEGD